MAVKIEPTTNGDEHISGVEDPLFVAAARKAFDDVVANATTLRSLWRGQDNSIDPRRDYDRDCGYPVDITIEMYDKMYEREPIAAKVVELLPKHCWRVQFDIWEDEDANVETQFEKDWKQLCQGLAGGSKLRQQQGNPVCHYMRQLDILSGIGQFGVMLIGFDDGKALSEPVVPRKGMRVLYLRCFSEKFAQITRLETDTKNPRCGQPVSYSLTFNDVELSADGNGRSEEVHWTRVIHAADIDHQASSNEVLAIPRMKPVFNRLCDLNKLYGGSAEMYWRGAFPGISFETHPSMGADGRADTTSLRNMVNAYQNSLQRYLVLFGMTAKSIAPQVVDPSKQIDVQIDAISMKMGCPKRIFMGSERGELASGQDKGDWNGTVTERQNGYLTNCMVRVFVDRMIWAKAVADPKQWFCEWPSLNEVTDAEKAEVGNTRTQALGMYVTQGLEAAISLMDFYTRFMGFSQEEATAILENLTKALASPDNEMGGKLFSTVGGIYGMTELWDKFQSGAYSEDTMKRLIMLFFKVDEAEAVKIIAQGVPQMGGIPPIGQPAPDVGTQKPKLSQFTSASSHDVGNQ